MRARGRGWLAAILAALAVVGAIAAQRTGAAPPAPASAGSAISSLWLCPHGGGDGWEGSIAIANPGTAPVEARVLALGAGQPRGVATIDVAPSSEEIVAVPAAGRAAATAVEIFGGWAAVGWSVRAGGGDVGVGAEPCTPETAPRWSVVDGVTTKEMRSSLVVMNPFAQDAVVDVVLYLPDSPPVRDTDWTDLRIAAGRSVALDLRRALGAQIVGATVTTTRGRVAVGSLAVRSGGGVRSVLASPTFTGAWTAPVTGGTGIGTLSLLVPGDLGIRFGATQLSADTAAQPAGNLTVVRQGGTSTWSGQVTTAGPSAILVRVLGTGEIGVGLREVGRGPDDAATGGTAASSFAWVVLPAITTANARSSVVLVNPSDHPVTATVQVLPQGSVATAAPVTVTIPAGRTAAVPPGPLAAAPGSAVLVTADGAIVALGAGTAGGAEVGVYAMALGVPMPSVPPRPAG